ncbi:hypothetical protein H2F19_23030 (plasmid) [Ralstonia solanacearum]|nr:hypothetical protein H2F19_23030 [Ralstonia solanacearum]
MSDKELTRLARDIRHLYWHIRTLRRGIQDAARRRVYRQIAKKKKRLLEAGVSRGGVESADVLPVSTVPFSGLPGLHAALAVAAPEPGDVFYIIQIMRRQSVRAK